MVGAVAASALLYVIASGAAGFDLAKGFASNGYGPHSPGQYSLFACFLMEVVMTMMFLFIIMGATHGKRAGGFCAAGDRTGAGDDPSGQHPRHQYVGESGAQHRPGLVCRRMGAGQLWLFWVAPLIGGVLGGVIYRWLSEQPAGTVQGD